MSKQYTKAELKKLEDTELVKLSQEGILAAFDELLKRNSHRIVSMLTQKLKSETDAYDVAQTAAVKAYRSIKSFNGTSQFYTWLYTIALNEARKRVATSETTHSEYRINLIKHLPLRAVAGAKTQKIPPPPRI